MSLNTAFLLMPQYNGKPAIRPEEVRCEFFSHMSLQKALWKLGSGDIALPVVRIQNSQKCVKGIQLQDLADHLEKR